MTTLLYAALGIFLLIAGAFLFTYFFEMLVFLSAVKARLSVMRRAYIPRFRNYIRMALRISDRNGYYPTARK